MGEEGEMAVKRDAPRSKQEEMDWCVVTEHFRSAMTTGKEACSCERYWCACWTRRSLVRLLRVDGSPGRCIAVAVASDERRNGAVDELALSRLDGVAACVCNVCRDGADGSLDGVVRAVDAALIAHENRLDDGVVDEQSAAGLRKHAPQQESDLKNSHRSKQKRQPKIES